MMKPPLGLPALIWWAVLAGIGSALAGSAENPARDLRLQLGEPVEHWLVLKPIPVMGEKKGAADDAARRQAFARDWLLGAGGENGIQPRSGSKVAVAGRTLKWAPLEAWRGPAELLVGGHPVEDALAYAWAEFEVPGAQAAVLGIGSDDSIKVWLNGKLVHENWTNRPARLDDDLVSVELQPGKNHLLLKVQNGVGPWGFACRVLSQAQADALRHARAEMANPTSETLTDEQIKTVLRDYIDADKLGVGMVVGIVDEHGSRVIGHGKLGNGSAREVAGDTLFEIGSVTKVFTALLLQDMVERGDMRFEDPVQKYLPDTVRLPTHQGKEVTLLHLATHTSGLPRDLDNATPRSWRKPGTGYTVEQFHAFLSGCKLRHSPGSKEEYSNVGLQLLGHVIALKAGKDYESLVLERICRPLGMDSTRITLTPELKARLATGYALPGSAVCNEDFSAIPAAGSIKSTANDLLKFVAAYSGLRPSPLRALMDKAESEHLLESGRKRRLVWFGEGPLFEHGGLTCGYKTELVFDARRRRGVVVLSNCASSGLVSDCWRPLLEGRTPLPAQTASGDVSLYDRYVGLYETDRRERCVVRRHGERLMLRWLGTADEPSGNSSFEVFPHARSVFFNKPWFHNQLVQVSFVPQDNKTKMLLATAQFCLAAARVSANAPDTPAPFQLQAALCERYMGRYRLALFGLIKFGPTLNILHESDEVGEHLVGYLSGRGTRAMLNRLGGGVPGAELFPVDEKTFFTPFSQVPLRGTFVQNKKGKTTGIIINLGARRLRGVRVGK